MVASEKEPTSEKTESVGKVKIGFGVAGKKPGMLGGGGVIKKTGFGVLGKRHATAGLGSGITMKIKPQVGLDLR